ncbi:MAG: hypothetical protein ACR2JS_03695 [Candidatus Nanopelagicales bacterium]
MSDIHSCSYYCERPECIKAQRDEFRSRLEKQEPVAMRYDFDGYGYQYIDKGSGSDWDTRIKNAEPLYAAPPQRSWQGLTDEEIMDACSSVWASHPIEVGHVVQDLLKEKNYDKS